MITCKSEESRYRAVFSNDRHTAYTDVIKDNEVGGSGFRPHDLLEAALAACLNIWVRIYADKHNIPLSGISSQVTLDRSLPDETVFEYSMDFQGVLSKEQREKLIKVAKTCPVHKTLSKKISFRNTDS